jgi:hypothetical protein
MFIALVRLSFGASCRYSWLARSTNPSHQGCYTPLDPQYDLCEQLRLPNRFEKINLQLESCEFRCLGECLSPGARRAAVTAFGAPENPGDGSQIAHRLVIQHSLNAFEETVAHSAIRIENALARAFDGGWIQRRPIDDIGGKGAGEFERLVMCLGRKGGDDVETRVFEILKCVGAMFCYVDPDFVHHGDGESIIFAAPDPGRREIDLPSEEMPAECLRHRRAYRISRTGEKHSLRAVYYSRLHPGGFPASCPAGIGT